MRKDTPHDDTHPEKRLSPFEWELLEICWQFGEPTVVDVHRTVIEDRPMNYNAVNCILKRMETKGWLEFDRSQNRRFRCRPIYSRDEALAIEVDHALDHLETRGDGALNLLRRRLAERTFKK